MKLVGFAIGLAIASIIALVIVRRRRRRKVVPMQATNDFQIFHSAFENVAFIGVERDAKEEI